MEIFAAVQEHRTYVRALQSIYRWEGTESDKG